MSSLRDYLPGAMKENPLITEAQGIEASIRADARHAITEWFEGAKAGINEIERAATNLGTNATPEQIKERMLTGMVDEELSDQNEQHAINWYDEATDTFKQETVSPLAVGATAIGGLPAATTMVPFIINSGKENIEELGVAKGLFKTVAESVPIVGTALQVRDERWQDFADQHPLRAALGLGFDVMSEVHPTVQAARWTRKNILIKSAKKTPLEAEQIVKGEFDLQETKVTNSKPVEPQEPKGSTKTISEYMNDRPISTFKTKKLKGQEAVEPTRNPKVSKSIDETIIKGFKDADEINNQRSDFMGAFGDDVVPLPPSYKGNVTLNQIRLAADAITPVRLGHMGTPKNTIAYAYNKEGGIRTSSFHDFSIINHEIGHYIDRLFRIDGADEELIKGAKSGRLKGANYKPNEWRGEGVAEFTATYLANPEKAREHFPKYYALFTEKLATNPTLTKKLDTLSEYTRAWYYQYAGARVRGTVAFQGDMPEKSSIEKIRDLKDATYSEWVDDTNALDVAIKKAGFDNLNFDENPQVFALALKNTIPGRVNALWGKSKLSTDALVSALEEIYNIPLHKVTMRDVYAPLQKLEQTNAYPEFLKKMNAKDYHEAFATFAYTRHALEVYDVQKERIANKLAKEFFKLTEQQKVTADAEVKAKLQAKIDTLLERIYNINTGKEIPYKMPNNLNDYGQFLLDAPSEFMEISEKLSQYNSNLLDIAVAYGLLSKETAKTFKREYRYYVPLTRENSIETGGNWINSALKDNYVNVDKFFKKLSETGSERVVQDPLTSMMRRTEKLISDGEHNIVGQKLAALAHTEKGELLMQPTNAGKPVKTGASSSFEHIIYVWKDGKKYGYQTIAPGLYEAVTSMSKPEAAFLCGAIEKVLKPEATLLRVGATSSPFYLLWQFLKDSLFSGISTKTGMFPFVGTLKGLDRLWFHADEYLLAKFEAEGIPFSTRVKGENIPGELRQLAGKAPFLQRNKVTKGILKGINWGLDRSYDFDAAPRIEEFKRGMEQGMSRAEAAAAARDITLNFSRAGTQGRKLNRVAAFFNAQVQGLDKYIRMLRENPRGTIYKSLLYLTLPTLAYWSYVRNQDWYRDIPYEDKMRNWYFQGASGQIYKIPKPDIPGYLFASVPEALLNELADKDPEALSKSNLGGFLLSNTLPTNILPTGVRPLLENYFNYNIFRGRPVVSDKELKKLSEDQHNAYTSEVAKSIGKISGYSPMKIDNILKGTTGSLGQMVLDTIDKFAYDKSNPEREAYESIRFFYTPGGRTRTNDVFYRGLENLEQRYNSSNKREKAAELRGMKNAQRSITKIRQQINNTLNNNHLTPAQKRERIDKFTKQINNIQRQANIKFLGYKYIQAPK